ncbi:hypothetical protein GGR54DRAFT_585601 [Hypoxylon sp. NC1633]|nr:hypothetical protein GGR54DRAFT_585601 [Hypoxylon sp. NC1633]
MAGITITHMPKNKSEWLIACKTYGIQMPESDSIHDIVPKSKSTKDAIAVSKSESSTDDSVVVKSGSKVQDKQYLLLRVIWPILRSPFTNKVSVSNQIIPEGYLKIAREALARDPQFQTCLEWLRTPGLSLAAPQVQNAGLFTTCLQSYGYTQGLSDNTLEPDKAEFSPIASRLRFTTQRVLESEPKTPTSPTPPGRHQAKDTLSSSWSGVDYMEYCIDEEEFTSPESSRSDYAADTPLAGEAAKQAIPIKNEQEVVFCLLSFLRAVCLSVPEGRVAHWKADQVEYTLDNTKGEKIFSARTDVNLQHGCRKGNQVIGETKRAHRFATNGGASIKAQESCQMVGWAFDEPPSGEELKRMRENKSTHQLISLSQCKDELYVNSGTYDANWLDYIRGKRSVPLSFLSIQEYGPYKLRKWREFQELATIVLALSLWKSEK